MLSEIPKPRIFKVSQDSLISVLAFLSKFVFLSCQFASVVDYDAHSAVVCVRRATVTTLHLTHSVKLHTLPSIAVLVHCVML
jgi:hypothetical protein